MWSLIISLGIGAALPVSLLARFLLIVGLFSTSYLTGRIAFDRLCASRRRMLSELVGRLAGRIQGSDVPTASPAAGTLVEGSCRPLATHIPGGE